MKGKVHIDSNHYPYLSTHSIVIICLYAALREDGTESTCSVHATHAALSHGHSCLLTCKRSG